MSKFGYRPHNGPVLGEVQQVAWSASELEAWPTLTEFLGRDRYDDATVRVTGTVLLFVEAGRVKVCLSDRDNLRVAFHALEGLEGLLHALEDALAGDGLDWRVSRAGKGAPKK